MKRDDDRALSFTRRALFVGALQGGFLAVLGGRLAWLQIAQGQRYKTLAEDNRINLKLIPPPRGLILDRNGEPMAVNGQNFRAVIIPEQVADMEKSLSRLQKLISLSQRDVQRVLKQVDRSPPFIALEIKDNLDWTEVSTVEVNLPDLPGISIDEGEVRRYPLKEAAAHVIGYVGAVNKSEQTGDPLLETPGFVIGKTGTEAAYDESLRGRSGTAEMEVNVVGREVRELRRKPAKAGEDVRLTIDNVMQTFVYNRLKNTKSASAVLMDVKTGDIYAMASFPAFDPNLFTRGISAELWEGLLADPGLPLNNKAAGGQYPPGSTFKMVTALAALEAGVIHAGTMAFCPGFYEFGDSRFHCWKAGGHGAVTLVDALAQSCDTFFYKLAVDLGVDRLAACARRLGLGTSPGLGLPEERAGLMPDRNWKLANFKEPWQSGESIVASIGQGYILSTPLQLAVMTARLASGGREIMPRIMLDSPLREARDIGFKKAHLGLVLRGMENVTGSPKGTAYAARIKDERFGMAGKTGTAQVKRITKKDRLTGVKNEDLPWRFRHHALFVGYAPVENPRYACSVVVEHGGGGSAVAAPVARDILHRTLQRDPAAQRIAGL